MSNKKVISIAPGTNLNTNRRYERLEEAIDEIAHFRYNLITRTPELKFKIDQIDDQKLDTKSWLRLNDFILNSIVRELRRYGINYASRNKTSEIIESYFSKRINPVVAYFKSLPKFDGDPIRSLAMTVRPVKWCNSDKPQEELFYKYLKKWLVGAVANVFITKRCANQICLILSGPQGCFKSTWIRHLSPPILEDYYIEGSLDPDDKDSILATATNFIFNLDDYFAGITSRKINEFKGLITKNTVKIRRAYAKYPEEMPKICSFIASSNETQFLHDSTGNRRFVAFEVKQIDINKATSINIDAVWSQAYQLFKSGAFVYWMESEDQDELAASNNKFEVQSAEYEALVTHMFPPKEGESPDADLTNAEIISLLQVKVNTKLSTKKLGEALRKAGFPRYQKTRNRKRSWVYGIIYADEADINIGRQPTNPDQLRVD